jgi:hypothetical protein
MQQLKIRNIIEYLMISLTGGVSFVIAILDLAGLFDSSSWIAKRVSPLTLLTVGSIASYLVLERTGKLNKLTRELDERSKEIIKVIWNSSSNTITSLDGTEVISFTSSGDLVSYAAESYESAQLVHDVTWSGSGTQPRSFEDIEAYKKYRDKISEIARSPNRVWSEIVIFQSNEHYQQEKKLILDRDSVAYNLAYFDVPVDTPPPRFGFAIVDDQEVLVSNSPEGIWLAIRHPDIVRYFEFYFESLWSDATKLKQSDEINLSEIKKLGMVQNPG